MARRMVHLLNESIRKRFYKHRIDGPCQEGKHVVICQKDMLLECGEK